MSKLIIVESPSKANTIQKYLKDQGYTVIASKGHIRDLPVDELGIDIDNNFEIKDVTIKGKDAVIKEIKRLAKDATEIFLASDPDREGEKISQSIYEILPKKGKIIKRVKFNSVTKDAIEKALKNAGDIDEKKCEAQKVRRILDRLVGYKISPILWNKIKSGVSAGRVQSVALRIIVEREDQINKFVPENWFSIMAKFNKDNIKFQSEYFGKTITKKEELTKKEDADVILKETKDKEFTVFSTEVKEKEQKATPPFTTSKLQQAAAGKLGFDTKHTMQVAQKLYEGIFIKDKGTQGLITYMRTDSVRVEQKYIDQLREYIEKNYGNDFLPEKQIDHKDKKAGNVQDAHEAIRPTNLDLHPEKIKGSLSDDEYKLYNLIYQKFVSSQMSNAIIEQTVVFLECEKNYFKTTGSVVKFEGFKKAFADLEDEKKVKKGEEEESLESLPRLVKEDKLKPTEPLKVVEKSTSPPPRFTEASLVKELEEKGIGRPSTYAAIISNITGKSYVDKEKNGRFKPTELGTQVCTSLVAHFPKEMDVKFTANVEDTLDKIEDGDVDWLNFVKDFWGDLSKSIDQAAISMVKLKKEEVKNSTKIKCQKCADGEYVIRKGKNGEFLACSNYPVCTSTQAFAKEGETIKIVEREQRPKKELKLVEKKCPKCKSQMALIESNGKEFYGCSNYPKCKTTIPLSTTGIVCKQCKKGELVKKISKNGKEFFGCSNFPECKNVIWDEADLKKK